MALPLAFVASPTPTATTQEKRRPLASSIPPWATSRLLPPSLPRPYASPRRGDGRDAEDDAVGITTQVYRGSAPGAPGAATPVATNPGGSLLYLPLPQLLGLIRPPAADVVQLPETSSALSLSASRGTSEASPPTPPIPALSLLSLASSANPSPVEVKTEVLVLPKLEPQEPAELSSSHRSNFSGTRIQLPIGFPSSSQASSSVIFKSDIPKQYRLISIPGPAQLPDPIFHTLTNPSINTILIPQTSDLSIATGESLPNFGEQAIPSDPCTHQNSSISQNQSMTMMVNEQKVVLGYLLPFTETIGVGLTSSSVPDIYYSNGVGTGDYMKLDEPPTSFFTPEKHPLTISASVPLPSSASGNGGIGTDEQNDDVIARPSSSTTAVKVDGRRNKRKGTNLYGRPYCPGRPLSMEERTRIIDLHLSGMKVNAISKSLCISHGCVSKIISRYRNTGILSPASSPEQRRSRRKNQDSPPAVPQPQPMEFQEPHSRMDYCSPPAISQAISHQPPPMSQSTLVTSTLPGSDYITLSSGLPTAPLVPNGIPSGLTSGLPVTSSHLYMPAMDFVHDHQFVLNSNPTTIPSLIEYADHTHLLL